jgi:putative ABC transport system ATP-binding protein
MLTLHNVTVAFNANTPNEVAALNNVSLNVEAGEFITVIGANGAGKSTLFNVVAGTVPVDRGRITLGQIDVTDWPEYRRSLEIGRVFQNPATGTCPARICRWQPCGAERWGSRLASKKSTSSGFTIWFAA